MVFEKYWDEKSLDKSIKNGDLISGAIRINLKNYEEAFVTHPDGGADVYIEGMKKRNRSLNGDVVHVQILPKSKWKFLIEDLNKSFDVVASAVEKIKLEVKNVPKKAQGKSVEKVTKKLGNLDLKKSTPGNENQSAKTSSKKYTTLEELCNGGLSNVSEQVGDCFKALTLDNGHHELILDSLPQVMRTGKVVGIAEQKNCRRCAGTLKLMSDNSKKFALFSPRDCRMPRIRVPANSCPDGFFNRPDDFLKILFVASIRTWDENSNMPLGVLEKNVGEVGSIESESEAILMENDVDDTEFTEEVLSCLPSDLPWKIPAEEYQRRRDFRGVPVITIDPETARDLDDALSCEDLGNGLYEVGVHIADVTYFVKSGTALDDLASERSTSVYLVQKVIPMLPRLLCEQLCSLNPGQDRLSFSVVWRMNEEGEILDEWFGKTVICSCAKLAYNHAQGFIDNPSRVWSENELPPVLNDVSIPLVVQKVLTLNRLALKLGKKRRENGVLRLDQKKIKFVLDKESGLPIGWSDYERLDSHSLIEEYMLLANMAVARRIYEAHSTTAILRRHPPPGQKALEEFLAICAGYGLEVDGSSAGALQESLAAMMADGSEETANKALIVIALCSKSMLQALYFCVGTLEDDAMWRHYALNVPLYTHFTSPIRRYPDILVHRQLAMALGVDGYQSSVGDDVKLLEKQCKHSNDKKMNAKYASDKSSELFLTLFVQKCGPLEEEGYVSAVLDHSFDVFVPKFAGFRRVYCEKLPLTSFSFKKIDNRPELTLLWAPTKNCAEKIEQKILFFTKVSCHLICPKDQLKWSLEIRHPTEEK